MPILLIFIMLFALWMRYEIKKTSGKTAKDNKSFLEIEQKANFTRKADISSLDYITIPVENLPFSSSKKTGVAYSFPASMDINTKNEILSCEKTVLSLSEKKIINLTGMSNTDIKLKFGAANLPVLMQYDENFSKLSRTLNKWGRLLFENSENKAAKAVLNFAVLCKCDIEETFLILANIYYSENDTDEIKKLTEAASCFDELRREKILDIISDSSKVACELRSKRT